MRRQYSHGTGGWGRSAGPVLVTQAPGGIELLGHITWSPALVQTTLLIADVLHMLALVVVL